MALLSGVLSACGGIDRQAASRENFEAILTTYFQKNQQRACPLQGLNNENMSFPFEAFVENIRPSDVNTLLQLQTLSFVKISQRDTALGKPSFVFRLTPQGAQHPGFCMGDYQYNRLLTFAQPADTDNGKEVKAALALTLKLDDWVKPTTVQDVLSYVKQRSKPFQARATLRLMEQGWQVINITYP